MDIIYLLAPKRKLLVYRLYRNAIVFLGIGQRYFFLIARAIYTSGKGRMNAVSVVFPNLAIIVIMGQLDYRFTNDPSHSATQSNAWVHRQYRSASYPP